jgi:hypothetical protein
VPIIKYGVIFCQFTSFLESGKRIRAQRIAKVSKTIEKHCVIIIITPFYGKLTPDQIYSPSAPVIGDTRFTSDSNQEPGGSPDISQNAPKD